jgi:hypothetical protein
MRANTGEGIGKELKIKRTFYAFTCMCDVSLRGVRIVCPRPKRQQSVVIAEFFSIKNKVMLTEPAILLLRFSALGCDV